ncbi:MuDR family transposase, putative isoform 2 [Hibiscus syriacus]|uniref:MuDR family transposase, putative isoform 2 n=1 Tax=Hibiscus syriacus TaxID=106335 RepID=A0A6A2WDM8_HIBSY|nr:MuDR family transposase, putative isoform 2 [Hibiscus syriacus]
MWNYNPDSLTIKYFIPHNNKSLIKVSNDKNLQHLLDFHGNSATVDIYVLTNENQTSDQLSMSHSRSGMVDEPVTPSIFHAASISGDTEQLDSLASLTRDMDNPKTLLLKLLMLMHFRNLLNCLTGLEEQFNNAHDFRVARKSYELNLMLKPREIINGILPDYGFKARYAHVWRGLESDKEKPQVPYDEGYNQLPSLLIRQIVENNLLFGALQASLHGFKNGCRPLLFLDTVTIKSKYQSKLLTVTALDGNEGIFPVAFAVADVVNDDNVETDENQRDFSYLCTEEVLQVIITHFYDAARATTLDDSENLSRTSKIFHQRLVSGSCTSLLQSGPEHWSNVLFQGYRYGHFSSNVADAFYSWITELSVIPIANKMIDTICCKMMELMSIQKSDSSQWLTKLTPAVEFKLEHHILKANMLQCQCHIVALSKSDSFGAIYVLNNDLWDCSCREWQLNGFPRCHAVAVLQQL